MIPLADIIYHGGQGLFGLVVLVLDIVAIVSLLRSTASTTHRVLWIVLILLFPCAGVFFYYLIGRSPRDG